MMKYLIPSLALAALAAAAQAQPPQGPPRQGPPDPAKEFIAQFDSNKDGGVSKDEFTKPQLQAVTQQLDEQFKYMDKDANGKVDAAEADAFAKEMQKRMEQMQSQMQAPPPAQQAPSAAPKAR